MCPRQRSTQSRSACCKDLSPVVPTCKWKLVTTAVPIECNKRRSYTITLLDQLIKLHSGDTLSFITSEDICSSTMDPPWLCNAHPTISHTTNLGIIWIPLWRHSTSRQCFADADKRFRNDFTIMFSAAVYIGMIHLSVFIASCCHQTEHTMN